MSAVLIFQPPLPRMWNNHILFLEAHQHVPLSYLQSFQFQPQHSPLNCVHFASTTSYTPSRNWAAPWCTGYACSASYSNLSPFYAKVFVRTYRMISVSQASLRSKIRDPRTFATLSDNLYVPTFYLSLCLLRATTFLSSTLKVSCSPPLSWSLVAILAPQPLSLGTKYSHRNTFSFLISFPSSNVLSSQVFHWSFLASAHSTMSCSSTFLESYLCWKYRGEAD